jgi:hypothetical protein
VPGKSPIRIASRRRHLYFNPPRWTFPFTVTTDASIDAIGAVLSQDFGHGQQPIEYASCRLNPAERNHTSYEQEALALISAIKT